MRWRRNHSEVQKVNARTEAHHLICSVTMVSLQSQIPEGTHDDSLLDSHYYSQIYDMDAREVVCIY